MHSSVNSQNAPAWRLAIAKSVLCSAHRSRNDRRRGEPAPTTECGASADRQGHGSWFVVDALVIRPVPVQAALV